LPSSDIFGSFLFDIGKLWIVSDLYYYYISTKRRSKERVEARNGIGRVIATIAEFLLGVNEKRQDVFGELPPMTMSFETGKLNRHRQQP